MPIVVILLVTVLGGRAARAHIDSLGIPDPAWQNAVDGSSTGGGPSVANSPAEVPGARYPWVLEGYLCASGVLLVALVGRRVRRELRSRTRRSAPSVRTVEVRPPSLDGELAWLFNAATFVIIIVIYVVAFETLGPGLLASPNVTSGLLPFQVLFRDVPALEQRTFRAMQEGVGELARLRSDSGTWPTVTSLADAGIPPFARDPLDKEGLQWSARAEGLVANYLGVPSSPGTSPLFLILIQEPDPVTGEKAPSPGVVDEEHQVLTDGTLLHVTYWKGTAPSVRSGIIGDPAIGGWVQIRVTSPSEEMQKWREQFFRNS